MSSTIIDYTQISADDDGAELAANVKTQIQNTQSDMQLRPVNNESETITGSWTYKCQLVQNESVLIQFRSQNNRPFRILQPNDSSLPFVFETANSFLFRVDLIDSLFISSNGDIVMKNLPTSSAGKLQGTIWNDNGTIKIV